MTKDPQRRRDPEAEGIPAFDETPDRRPADAGEHGTVLPGDRPAAANDRVTASEQRERESIDTRLAREQADEAEEGEETVGRVVEETRDGRDVTRELEATKSGDRSGLSAEEEAVRYADEPMPDDPSTDQASDRGADRGA